MSKTQQNGTIQEYQPRHLRLHTGVGSSPWPEEKATMDVMDYVPLLDDKGEVVTQRQIVRTVPCSEHFSKFKKEDFKLENLLEAGVPLKQVSINRSVDSDLVISKAHELGLLAQDFEQYRPSEEPEVKTEVKPENVN